MHHLVSGKCWLLVGIVVGGDNRGGWLISGGFINFNVYKHYKLII